MLEIDAQFADFNDRRIRRRCERPKERVAVGYFASRSPELSLLPFNPLIAYCPAHHFIAFAEGLQGDLERLESFVGTLHPFAHYVFLAIDSCSQPFATSF